MMDWYGDGPGWAGWLAMTLVMLAFWAVVGFGVIALVRSLRGGDRRQPDAREAALLLLRERFARGEIDADDYARRRHVLGGGHDDP